MEDFNRQDHWQNIYDTKQLTDVSWYQPIPQTSLDFVVKNNLPKTAKIIDIGGGDSFFATQLLDMGYTDITVLDISEIALERAKERLGNNARKIKWIVADAAHFEPIEKYDFWHDRAAFHFLTEEKDIINYVITANAALSNNALLTIGTFSENGPKKCSGIDIKQYSQQELNEAFTKDFEKLECFNIDHKTPFDTIQNFTFCSFRKR
ncbi:class I SAM-dependent methyltransferase [Flavobacterium sp. AG291]|uniref:class I SAM-dependent methyltransferase n=1 Tax=Flavobacterium sp. AG291 TaxID=2184000 RepID=UPI000E0A5333|nr:class I SAM-dependent methyltransferase [Flavobacterium sp. AG291]RDI08470.1 methyltransferase family protein [Flavobacterium sp. AG291]